MVEDRARKSSGMTFEEGKKEKVRGRDSRRNAEWRGGRGSERDVRREQLTGVWI